MNRNRKMKGFSAIIAIIAIAVILLIAIVPTYNNLASSRENVNKAYAQVQNVVQRRADLIPNLVNTVKGYTKHEEDTLKEVTNARAGVNNAKNPEELAKANEELTKAVGNINVVVEAYPELKADTQFVSLMDEIAGSENRISVERKNYNEACQEFNSKLVRFPTNLIGKVTGFKQAEYFKASESAQEAPTVDFNK
ncbi:LemA family protein [Anaerococcus tetradius]|uniref:LemA family protein n=1 Tax=Anaerococcus tetradius ATCC 35098 TaxID=525255 RepID=C2CFF8_9FIRM|nr:LemA family protein [Anaerococcus tetradius]EEI83777.1 LemA family protein [Anaerococcus tetradius ATCC 35098]